MTTSSRIALTVRFAKLVGIVLITLDCGTAFAQTKVPADTGTQVFNMPPAFVDSKPRPTFIFNVAPRFRDLVVLQM
jgi:hypothetical protein